MHRENAAHYILKTPSMFPCGQGRAWLDTLSAYLHVRREAREQVCMHHDATLKKLKNYRQLTQRLAEQYAATQL
jgi:hypothetical protein